MYFRRRAAITVFILVLVNSVVPYCDYGPWSSWSPCNYPCRELGTQSRSRSLRSSEGYCSESQQSRQCSGVLPVNCELSSWSEWSSCSVDGLCHFSKKQTSTRRKSQREGCGGVCKDPVYKKTRQCECLNEGIPDRVNGTGTCECKDDYYGACCDKKKESAWNKAWLGLLSVLLFICCAPLMGDKRDSRVGPG